ncbi:hypothetical protein QC763_0115640 (mitochondrion) [Podospora pseudopauciseta]|uniref:Uncharacterized protein n=1 Tax=Podospora pseudopauciseta TaxID=2093780 RepID=A0ABR0GZG9_9PEZI|nr:hypothetical protein QC763_0115640 [Podospora pseudopauciseta]
MVCARRRGEGGGGDCAIYSTIYSRRSMYGRLSISFRYLQPAFCDELVRSVRRDFTSWPVPYSFHFLYYALNYPIGYPKPTYIIMWRGASSLRINIPLSSQHIATIHNLTR